MIGLRGGRRLRPPDIPGVSERGRDYVLCVGMFAAALAVMYAVVRVAGIPSSVYEGYFPYADAMMHRVVPYTEDVHVYGGMHEWEYPPLAYPFLLVPRLFAATAGGYEAAFMVMVGVFFAAGLWCMEVFAGAMGRGRLRWMLAYTALMLLMVEFVGDRYDIIPVVLTMLSAALLVRGRTGVAFAVLAVAVLTKLYPAVLLPILLIWLLTKGERGRALTGAAVFVAAALAMLAPFYALGADPLEFLSYHTDRPLEVESLASSVIAALSLLGLTEVGVEFSYGSDNLVGPLPDAVGPFVLPTMVALAALSYVVFAHVLCRRRPEGFDPADLASGCLLAVLIFVAFGTVFSGQYMMWPVPFLLLFLMANEGTEAGGRMQWLFLAAVILTDVCFGVNFGMRGEGEDLSAAGILVILARNVLMLAMAWLALGRIRRGAPGGGPGEPAEEPNA